MIEMLKNQPIVVEEAHKEKLRRRIEDIKVDFIEPKFDFDFGAGTLFIHEEYLGFYSESVEQGFKIDYRNLVLHAIGSVPEEGKKTIYLQCDKFFDLPILSQKELSEGYDPLMEFQIILSDPELADTIYNLISHCQFLNPDFLEGSSLESFSTNQEEMLQNNLDAFERALQNGNMKRQAESEPEVDEEGNGVSL